MRSTTIVPERGITTTSITCSTVVERIDTPALPTRRSGWTPAAGYNSAVTPSIALGAIPPRRRDV